MNPDFNLEIRLMNFDFNIDFPLESSPQPENDAGGYYLLSRHPLYYEALRCLYFEYGPPRSLARLQRQFPDYPDSLIFKAMQLAVEVMAATPEFPRHD